ncbi:hypothetical protein [Rhodococcus opacus]|uniref:hypothetical protein n=1 Tax=Rhodococcus opacus TaxID=37919 RepID=UPI001F570BE3|nr:hypothetical protein [Rhodococcus opacus]UNN00739.1 hypothetical protein MOO23_34855 [Rhodococcus opacus]
MIRVSGLDKWSTARLEEFAAELAAVEEQGNHSRTHEAVLAEIDRRLATADESAPDAGQGIEGNESQPNHQERPAQS